MYTKRPFEQSTGSCVTINEHKQLYTCMLPYFLEIIENEKFKQNI